MRTIRIITIIGFVLLFTSMGLSQTASNYLILQSIGTYHNSGKGKCANGSGLIAATGHFKIDHNDLTCRTGYYNTQQDIAVSVQVTQHTGSDSDRWLLHEVEDSYRSSNIDRLGLLTEGAILRKMGGNKVYWIGIGGGSFVWLSNNVVIKISYTDLQATKPEPLEVIQVYLQKYPSTIPSTLVLDRTHDEQWIKDEMNRRLWLCDKWLTQIGKADLYKTLSTIVDHMAVFLAYREKYFGVSGKGDASALMRYLTAKDETSIRNKLTEYKNWWNVNKTGSINLP